MREMQLVNVSMLTKNENRYFFHLFLFWDDSHCAYVQKKAECVAYFEFDDQQFQFNSYNTH